MTTLDSIPSLVDAALRLGALRRVGALRIHERFAVGGMAALHFGWLVEARRLVAVKRVHPHLLGDETFTRMLLDEARLALQIDHPNVGAMVGVLSEPHEVLVAMDYVPGASLAELLRARPSGGIEASIAAAIMTGVLDGLHAAHEARGPKGDLLGIVHRDVSPQNVLLGEDGVPRIVDFGIAKAKIRLQVTLEEVVRGKLPYVSPEELSQHRVDARSDVYAAAVVLWEILTGRPLFHAGTVEATLRRILSEPLSAPSAFAPGIPPELDAVVLRGLARDPDARYASARAMARALERALPCAAGPELAGLVGSAVLPKLRERRALAQAVTRREEEACPSSSDERDLHIECRFAPGCRSLHDSERAVQAARRPRVGPVVRASRRTILVRRRSIPRSNGS